MASAAAVVCLVLLWAVAASTTSDDTKNITAKPGEDVLLHCQAPRGADITLVKWSRPDLKSNKYVFSRNGNHTNGIYQLPSYRGRVTLSDPEMKDGDVSVVLKNVSINDTGTYECRVGIKKGEEPKVYSTIQLNVSVSGHTDGDEGDKDEGDKDEGDKDGGHKDGGNTNRHYGLIAAVLFVVITVLVFILWVHKRPQNNNSADEEAGPQQDTLINFLDQRNVNNHFTDNVAGPQQDTLLDQRTVNNHFTDDEAGSQQETSMDILDQRSMNYNSEQPAADEAG